jgi:glutamyl-tRNA synthetase
MPRFAHLSLLLKPDGKGKLSKRDGDKLGFPVFPLRWVNPEGEVSRGYREDGYFPEAFVNLLAFLGWNPGDDREILSMDELVQAFSLDRIVRSGARFSVEKAHWYNREYLRMKSTEELTGLFIPILEQNGIHREKDYVAAVVALTRERVTFVADFWTVAKCLFVAPDTYDEKDAAKFWTAENAPLVGAAASWLCKDYSGPWTKEGIEEALVEHIRSQEWPMGKVMNALRLALTGAASGLGIADLAALLGPAEVAARVAAAEKALMK